MRLEMTTSPRCAEEKSPVKRKELGYHVCVDCSTAKPVVGITTVEGSGDHTYNDIIIMDQDRALAIQAAADEIAGKFTDRPFLYKDEELFEGRFFGPEMIKRGDEIRDTLNDQQKKIFDKQVRENNY